MAKIIEENSQAIQAHLNIMQNVIQRMASNSTGAKAWCIALVSAVLVIVADKSKPDYAFIALIPTLLFLILDAYYLGLEKGFRNSYNEFITRLHDKKIDNTDLFAVVPTGKQFTLLLRSLISFSVWPFYITILVMILIIKYLVL